MKTQTSAVLMALCLGASGASLASASRVADLSARENAFSGHQHSDAFLGFMRKHGKRYCEGESACEVSVLRERIYNFNKEIVDAHNANPGASSSPAPTASIRIPKCPTPHRRTFSFPPLTPFVLALLPHPQTAVSTWRWGVSPTSARRSS